MTKATRSAMLLLFTAALVLPGPGNARADNRNVTIGIILQPVNRPLNCSDLRPVGCSDSNILTTGQLDTEYYALVCAFGGDPDPAEGGIGGMEFGITYDDATNSGVDLLEWRLCGDLEFPMPDWPASNSGNVVTWAVDVSGEGGFENCQNEVPGDPTDGVTAIAGFFWLTASDTDRLSIIKRPLANGGLKVTNCRAAETELNPTTQAGSAAFTDGDEKGSLPCIKRVEEDTTWGFIKSTYGN